MTGSGVAAPASCRREQGDGDGQKEGKGFEASRNRAWVRSVDSVLARSLVSLLGIMGQSWVASRAKSNIRLLLRSYESEFHKY
jgi:hypothetical protein